MLLPEATFVDSFQRTLPGMHLSAEQAIRSTLEHPPVWISGLMNLRDRLVAIVGLKGLDKADHGDAAMIGGFPVVFRSPERVVLGFDDKHLDFRIAIDVQHRDSGTEIRATTLVRPHHWGGRVYLGLVMPFHKRIVPSMLNRIGAQQQAA